MLVLLALRMLKLISKASVAVRVWEGRRGLKAAATRGRERFPPPQSAITMGGTVMHCGDALPWHCRQWTNVQCPKIGVKNKGPSTQSSFHFENCNYYFVFLYKKVEQLNFTLFVASCVLPLVQKIPPFSFSIFFCQTKYFLFWIIDSFFPI